MQRNALKSWTLLDRDAEVILFGDEEGGADAAKSWDCATNRASSATSLLRMTRRHRVYGYMRACAALVLGYHDLHLFDDARRKRKEWMSSSPEKTLVALPAKAKAAAATKS